MNNTKPTRAFMVRMSRYDNDEGSKIYAIKNGIIGVGWGKALDALNKTNWGQFKKAVKDVYPHLQTSNQKLGNEAGSLWRFLREEAEDAIKKGDYIILPSAKKFYIGICESEPFHSDDKWAIDNDFEWQRKVKWLNNGKPFERLAASVRLQNRLKARQTCVDASIFINDINQVIDNPEKSNFTSKLLEETKSSIANTINNHVNADQLERLVEQLCKRSGAIATRPSKNSSSDGDVDIIADYPVSVGFDKKIVRVLYQVKRHATNSETGQYAVQQVIDRMKVMQDEKFDENVIQYIGCVVTTAEKLTNTANELADEQGIEIICNDKLIEWLLNIGMEGIEL